MRILELFSGIGGVAAAVRQTPALGQIHQAVDIDQQCASVYAHNFGLKPTVATIESPHSWQTHIAWRSADTWWLSPPCQPYCRRGRQAADDPRRAALQQVIRVLQRAGEDAPGRIAMENVPEFRGSDDHQQWLQLLNSLGYRVTEHCLCPSAWQRPNRRLRYYLTAWRSEVCKHAPPPVEPPVPGASEVYPLSTFLDAKVADELWIDDTLPGAFATALEANALHIVDAEDAQACTACFTGGYGKSIKQAGSYLRVDGRLRRFSSSEIPRLLGFDAAFAWPEGLSLRRQWKMLGNSLAVPVVAEVLKSLR